VPSIALMSDLHLDHHKWTPPSDIEADLLVLAGDIVEAGGPSPVEWALAHLPKIPTVFVPGNHDFYGGRVGKLLELWRKQCRGSHVRVLYNETLSHAGMHIIGTPLWSGLDLNRHPIQEAHLRRTLPMRIADFSHIYSDSGKSWRVAEMLHEAMRAREFIAKELSKGHERSVVITHWAPARPSISPRFLGDELNPYFVNDLPDLVEQASVWLHGHVHDECDYQVGQTPGKGRVVCHPRGYKSERPGEYRPKIIEV
jgi:predicted phosphohydrolase